MALENQAAADPAAALVHGEDGQAAAAVVLLDELDDAPVQRRRRGLYVAPCPRALLSSRALAPAPWRCWFASCVWLNTRPPPCAAGLAAGAGAGAGGDGGSSNCANCDGFASQ